MEKKEEKTAKNSVFATLNAINVNGHTEKKNGLTYLSWAWAWAKVKENYPTAIYTIYEDANGRPYHTDGRTCWVKTGVTIDGLEHIEYLPVMDFRNASIPEAKVTSYDVNKSIQRSLTKACARHGLGLYIYAGEDLPEGEAAAVKSAAPTPSPAPRAAKPSKPAPAPAIEHTPSIAAVMGDLKLEPKEPDAKKRIIDQIMLCSSREEVTAIYVKLTAEQRADEDIVKCCQWMVENFKKKGEKPA